MELGAFSISLTVQDIARARTFYETLGFAVFGGQQDRGWLIMKQGSTLIGLFQGMFDKNLLTFNPGWDSDAKPLAAFSDVRQIQQHLRAHDIPIDEPVDESTQGPGYLTLQDPDGNRILIDQHR